MADLDPLIKMRKHLVDQKQKFLADLYKQADDLANQKAAMLEQLKSEREAVNVINTVEATIQYGRYAEVIKSRLEDIGEAIMKMEVRIEVAREDMRTAFADLKKIEITQERREAEEEKARDKKESNELDEIAIDGFRRGKDSNN